MGDPAGAAAAEDEADAAAGEAAGEALLVAAVPETDVVVVRDVRGRRATPTCPAAPRSRRDGRGRARFARGASARRAVSSIAPGTGLAVASATRRIRSARRRQRSVQADPLRTRVEEEVPGAVLELAERDVDGEAQGAGERGLGGARPSVALVEGGRVEGERVAEGAEALGEGAPEAAVAAGTASAGGSRT